MEDIRSAKQANPVKENNLSPLGFNLGDSPS